MISAPYMFTRLRGESMPPCSCGRKNKGEMLESACFGGPGAFPG
jgi:hypothetical protein